MTSGHGGPGTFHPPHGEGIAESLVSQVVASSQLGVHVVTLQYLVQEVNVARRQLEGLDLAQLVRGQSRDYLAQRGEGFIQGLRPLALPNVGDGPLAGRVLQS